ncbi:MAG: undecaprenyl-diphosphate phosphatase [Actinomycetes bacterium]
MNTLSVLSAAQAPITYLQAILIGLIQGVTELFPISSLGHSVLVPEWFGWHNVVQAQSADESFYLAFLVALHVATALALLVFFRDEWKRVVIGFFQTLRTRRIDTPDQRMAWLLIVGTIPVGVVGLVFEHKLRTVFAKPTAAAVFLCINGLILIAGEFYRRRASVRALAAAHPQHVNPEPGRSLESLQLTDGAIVGSSEIVALFAGISRSGVTMVTGLARGLDHEDAARLSFMLATPVILLAGLYKIPGLLGHNGDGVRGQALVGAVVAGIASYFTVRFLVRFFETRTLWPFAVYCLVAGALSLIIFA